MRDVPRPSRRCASSSCPGRAGSGRLSTSTPSSRGCRLPCGRERWLRSTLSRRRLRKASTRSPSTRARPNSASSGRSQSRRSTATSSHPETRTRSLVRDRLQLAARDPARQGLVVPGDRMNARLRLPLVGETMFPPPAPFFWRAWGTSHLLRGGTHGSPASPLLGRTALGFPTLFHTHAPGADA